MRIGIFGGTFNPVHIGHLIVAEDMLIKKNLDRVIFVPCGTPPHKKEENLLKASLRYTLLKLAIEGDDRFLVDDLELNRAGYSFTIDTMTELTQKYSQDSLFFIIGADSLFELHKWKDAQILVEKFSFIIARRDKFDLTEEAIETIPFPNHLKDKLKNGIVFTPMIDVSSTLIRDRLNNNNSIRYLVPEKVREYIEEKKLFPEKEED